MRTAIILLSFTACSFISILCSGQTWCTPSVIPYNNNMPGITNVTFNTINRTSAALESSSSNYVNTLLTTTLIKGQSYPFSMKFNVDASICGQANLRVWIDWDRNGILVDAGETVVSVNNKAPGTYTVNIVVPMSASTGTTKMRVTSKMTTACAHTLPTPCNIPEDPLDYHGGVEDYDIIISAVSGVEDIYNNKSVSVYPNPVKNELTIETPSFLSKQKLEIFNAMGQNIYSSDIYQKKVMDVSNLAEGVYFIRLSTDEFENCKRFVKQ